jgi:hypothetical protein
MPSDVLPAERNFGCFSRPAINRQLSEAALHPAGQSNRNLRQQAVEVAMAKLAVQRLQSAEQAHIARPRALAPSSPFRAGRIDMDRKLEKLSFRRSPMRSRDARVQKSNDGLEHSIRGKGVSSVDPEHPPAQAQHDCLIGMGDDSLYIFQAKFE